VFLHPRQAAAALAREPGVTAHRFVIDRTEHRDTLRCEIVAAPAADPQLTDRVQELIRAHLRLSAEVVRVPALPDGPTIHDQRTWS
jgi:phenylacetate-CoA ligase